MTTHIIRISLSEPESRGGTFHHVGKVGDFSELLKVSPELGIVQPGYATSAIEVLPDAIQVTQVVQGLNDLGEAAAGAHEALQKLGDSIEDASAPVEAPEEKNE